MILFSRITFYYQINYKQLAIENNYKLITTTS